jgi:endonuclease III-like uncharacterized protein
MQGSSMATDSVLVYLGTAVRLVGLNRFYTRRVLQRCGRGEITLEDAAKLLMAAAKRDGARVEIVSVEASS